MDKLERFLAEKGLQQAGDGVLSCKLSSISGLSQTARNSLAAREVKQEDNYLTIPFRVLSATIIPDYMIDFSKPGVLQQAVEMFESKTMYKNHKVDVNTWIGKTRNARWTEENGDIPAGVDVDAMIYTGEDLTGVDAEQQRLVIGLRERILYACSSTVFFQWEKSHPELEGWNFWENLGREVDDEIVRLVVTQITDVGEVSIVWMGADPFAQRQDALSVEFSKEWLAQRNLEKAEDLQQLVSNLEKDKQELSDSQQQLQGELKAAKQKLETTNKELSGYKNEILDTIRKQRTLMGDAALMNETFEKFLQNQNIKALLAFSESLQEQLNQKFPLQCENCGSRTVSRQASVNQNDKKQTKKRVKIPKI